MNRDTMYRPPAGRPRSIPPCDPAPATLPDSSACRYVFAALPASMSDRPTQQPGETRQKYGSRISMWLEEKYPERKAARLQKISASLRRRNLKRRRLKVGLTAQETDSMRWYRYADLMAITGWSDAYLNEMLQAREWPMRKVRRRGRGGNNSIEVYGDISTLPRRRIALTPGQAALLKEQDLCAKAITPSIWQRIVGWFR